MKKITFLFLVLILPIFTSCGGKTNPSSQDNHICSFSNMWSKNDSKHWKECSCGKRSEEASHSFGEWQEIEQATTSKEGLKEQTCSICNYKKQEKINKLEPLYSWKSVDLLQPNIIIGGTSSIVLDENGNKVEFTKLVDRQLDMLAQEIVSRLEYVYGDTNKNETHNIIDNLNNTTFTTYNSMNVFSESLDSKKSYPVYRYNPYPSAQQQQVDPYIERGYIEMQNGKMVEFDSKIHSHYIILNNKKYAAICSENAAGNFTSETSLQFTFETLGAPTIYHKEIEKYYTEFLTMYHAKVLTFQNAIYGTPTWEYEVKGVNQIYADFSYNANKTTIPWNWAVNFKNGTAINKLKIYLAYIVANKISSYNELPLEDVIISANYTDLLKQITSISNYVIDYSEIIFKVISNRIVGTKLFENDIHLGQLGDEILIASYVATISSYYEYWSGQYHINWENGLYDPLYQVSSCGKFAGTDTMGMYFNHVDRLNRLANSSFSMDDLVKVYDYKGYDTIINGILRQISNQTAYKSLLPESYQSVDFVNKQFITTETDESHIYLFLKTKTSNDIRFVLSVPYDTNVTLKDKNGNVINFTKENVDGKLCLRLKSSDLPSVCTAPNDLSHIQGYGASSSLDELLKDLDYLELIISGVSSFSLGTEEYVQTN